MADRYQERPFLAADYDRGDPHGCRPWRERSAGGAGKADRTERPVGGCRPSPPRIRCSRGPIFARSIPRPSNMIRRKRSRQRSAEPAVMDAARAARNPRHRRRCRRTTTTSRNTSRRRCIRCIATRPSSRRCPRMSAAAQDYYEQPQQYRRAPSRSRIRRATTMRCMAGSKPASTTISAIRPIRTIPTPTRASYEEEPAPKKRSSGLMTVAAVLALAVVGTGGCLCLSHLCRFTPQRRAADHQGRQQPDQGGAGASPMRAAPRILDRMLSGDGGEKLVSREETPVDVNSRSGGPRVVFPPLNQNATRRRSRVYLRRRRMATAANGTMPNNEPRRIRTLAVKGDAADNGGIPAGATCASAEAGDARRRSPGCGSWSWSHDTAGAQPGLGQCQRQYADVAFAAGRQLPIRRRPGWRRPIRPRRPPRPVVAIWFRSPRRRTRPTRRPPIARCRASSRACWAPHSSLVKRADLGEKGVYYRALAGPFGSSEEAAQVCSSLKSAGGQCFVQRN